MKDTVTFHCQTCAREFEIPREEYQEDEFRLYCEKCRKEFDFGDGLELPGTVENFVFDDLDDVE